MKLWDEICCYDLLALVGLGGVPPEQSHEATQDLGNHIANVLFGAQGALDHHHGGNGWVEVAAANAAAKVDGSQQGNHNGDGLANR